VIFIKARGIKVESSSKEGTGDVVAARGPTSSACLDPPHPACVRVTLDETGVLLWPVMFVYPEYGETDVISSLSELSL